MNKYDPIKDVDEEFERDIKEQRQKLNITQEDIEKAREYIKKSIRVDSNTYNHLVDLISHPSAIIRLQLIPDSKNLQIKLNKTIGFNRKIFCLGLIIGLIGLFSRTLPLIILSILIFIYWYFVLPPRQTLLNIELGARLFAVDSKENPKQFQESYEAMNQLYKEKFGSDCV
jgi:hypothetical protein